MMRWAEGVFRVLMLAGMTVCAGAGIAAGFAVFSQWRNLAPGTLTYEAVSLGGGVALLLGLVLALSFPSRLPLIALGSFVLALGLAINQTLGLYLKTILCFTPS